MKRIPVPQNVKLMMNETLENIIPTKKELKKISKTVEFLKKIIENSEIPDELNLTFIEPQGSTGIKQTSIKNAADIDLFIGIHPSYILNKGIRSKTKMREFIRKKFKQYVKKWLIPCLYSAGIENPEISYAEHPYVSAQYENLDLDIVLCFDLDEQYLLENGPITAVDRTPHHSRFIRNNLSEEQRNDIRLLKYIFKNYHCYGDKTVVGQNGFMGYSAELLVLYYGDLWNVMLNFKDLIKTFVNFFDYITVNKDEALTMYENKPYERIISSYFPTDTLIILDPTDYKRNVASSISKRTYLYMAHVITEFTKSPSHDFFTYNNLIPIENYNPPQNLLDHYYFAEYKVVQEDHYTKYRDKLYSMMTSFIEHSERESTGGARFKGVVGELNANLKTDIYVLGFFTDTPEISQEYTRKGPKASNPSHSQRFIEKHPNAYEVDGFYYIDQKRSFSRFIDYLKSEISNEKIKGLQLIKVGNAREKGNSRDVRNTIGILFDIIRKKAI